MNFNILIKLKTKDRSIVIIKKLLQVDRAHHKQFFDEWDRIFAMQLKRINQCIEEHRLLQVIVNHECPINPIILNTKKKHRISILPFLLNSYS